MGIRVHTNLRTLLPLLGVALFASHFARQMDAYVSHLDLDFVVFHDSQAFPVRTKALLHFPDDHRGGAGYVEMVREWQSRGQVHPAFKRRCRA